MDRKSEPETLCVGDVLVLNFLVFLQEIKETLSFSEEHKNWNFN